MDISVRDSRETNLHSSLFHFYSVEVTGLDQYIDHFFNQLIKSRQAISFPQCPRANCNKTIRHCRRYSSIINQIQLWIQQVQFAQQNGLNQKQMLDASRGLLKTIRLSYISIQIQIENIDELFNRLLNIDENSINIDTLNFLHNTDEYLQRIR